MKKKSGTKTGTIKTLEHPLEIVKVVKRKIKLANSSYLASIKVMGKIYTAGGATLPDAITNLRPEGLVRGMSIITVKNGDTTQEKILPRIATARLFAPSKMIREVALKNVIGRFSI